MMNRRLPVYVAGLVLLLALFLVAAVPASGQEPVSDDEVNEVARDLYCPVCENTPLDVCPTQACSDWRELIRQQLAEGRSEQEIQAYFVEQYGARVLSAPPRQGFNLIVWILPVLGVLVGAVFFGRYLAGLRTKHEAGSAIPQSAAEPVDDDYLSRVEKELRER